MSTITVTREGKSFTVVDDPQTRSWSFWENEFAGGNFEPAVMEEISKLTADQTFLDIGAWVGPTAIWGAQFCSKVIAVEPDPVALKCLIANASADADNIQVVSAAVSDVVGKATLHKQGALGNSMSSLQNVGEATFEVITTTVPELIKDAGTIGLVKIDVEGGEGRILAAHADVLRSLNCPILLSLHYPWMDSPGDALATAKTLGEVTYIDKTVPNFPSLLIRP